MAAGKLWETPAPEGFTHYSSPHTASKSASFG